ncbi:MAG: spore coat associated protein CotJA [Lachnospiraceae bacterium]|nr:spore coat associated protein CotJA [Lachnospiraceae bacterium]
MNPRPSCSCQPVNRAGFNVCRPGECPPDANSDIAMGYVPWQQWECTYPLNRGLFIGTVFPSLDKPFMIGRCAVRP